MAKKKKDKDGKLLRKGESQRPTGTYQYRYKLHPKDDKYRYVSAKSLTELRKKEAEIQKSIELGLDYEAGQISVEELVERYLQQFEINRPTTRKAYNTYFGILKKDELAKKKISVVKPSDARLFLKRLSEEKHYAYDTINGVKCIVGGAFQMAFEDEIVLRNPFHQKLRKIIPKTENKRTALTRKQQRELLTFVSKGTWSRKHYNEIVILLKTGLRVSEMYGLTLLDVDIDNRRIHVGKQLQRDSHGVRYIQEPKTKSGYRTIPLPDEALKAFTEVLSERKVPSVEKMIDGYTGFVFLDRNGNPKTAENLERAMHRIVQNYNKCHDIPIEATPHILRHTYSSEIGRAGLSAKVHQTLMGHADIRTTMNRYTHVEYEAVENEFFKKVGT